jgi:hypothetical protein
VNEPCSEVWAAEAASRAEATFAGSGSSHAAAPPRLAYARELGLPPPLQLVVVGRGLHSSTFQLNLSALYGTGGVRKGLCSPC